MTEHANNERLVSVEDYARAHYVPVGEIMSGIGDGVFIGRQIDGKWFVSLPQESAESRTSVLIQQVEVTNISMPLLSMVVFMVKWTIASIPALALLTAIFLYGGAVLYGLLTGVGAN